MMDAHQILVISGYIFCLSTAFFVGWFIGRLREKRKRDKQMAGIVTERLLGKPKVALSENMQASGNSSMLAQQMAQGEQSQYFNSSLGDSGKLFGGSLGAASQSDMFGKLK